MSPTPGRFCSFLSFFKDFGTNRLNYSFDWTRPTVAQIKRLFSNRRAESSNPFTLRSVTHETDTLLILTLVTKVPARSPNTWCVHRPPDRHHQSGLHTTLGHRPHGLRHLPDLLQIGHLQNGGAPGAVLSPAMSRLRQMRNLSWTQTWGKSLRILSSTLR